MQETLDLRVTPKVAAVQQLLSQEVARRIGVNADSVRHVIVTRRSIDARQRQVMVNLSVRAYIDEDPSSLSLIKAVEYSPVAADARNVIVVGAGPAGLFAALRLIEEGLRPIVLERGKDVDSRRADMADIARKGIVNPDSNYCFGEGGAGAFSDGKLYTRSKKRGPVDKILNIFAQHGASENILVDAHPHIGTDKLPGVIKAMRETICRCGGEVHFSTRVESLIIDGEEVRGVIANGKEYHGPVILATGHSARDMYRSLLSAGVAMEPKGLAVGVRLEHPQHLIDCLRYHSKEGRGKYLPAAEYTMLTRVDDRGVYSFCMCPGGVVIPSASGPEQLAVNGMSGSARSSRWANAAMVVEVLPEDIPAEGTDDDPDGILRMLRFQESIEKAFWLEAGQSQNAPAQRMMDFINGRMSSSLPPVSYAPGAHPARIDKLLPKGIARRLQLGFKDFDRKNRGFLTNEAVLIGAETRTSSPLRIPRDGESLRHIQLKGLYPCGEGAGYAGGIVSAAIDGDRSAAAVAAESGTNNS